VRISAFFGERAAFTYVPGNIGGVCGIRVIGTCLTVDTHNPERGDGGVCDGSEEGVPDVEDEHDGFHQ
jgi:hypothetical protein